MEPTKSYVSPYGTNGSECHYCYESEDGRISYGMIAKQLTVDDYLALCDTGWRRSGTYIYRPDNANEKTCCPQYTIRLDVCRFKPSKDNKQVCNRFDNYIQFDDLHAKSENKKNNTDTKDTTSTTSTSTTTTTTKISDKTMNEDMELISKHLKPYFKDLLDLVKNDIDEKQKQNAINHLQVRSNPAKFHKDRGQYSCNISPLLIYKTFIESSKGGTFEQIIQSIIDQLKNQESLRTFTDIHFKDNHINFKLDKMDIGGQQTKQKSKQINSTTLPPTIEPKHKIDISIRKAEYTDEMFQLYCKYQTIVHNDTEPMTIERFTRFLVDTPLVYIPYSEDGYYSKRFGKKVDIPQVGFGSFHQYYHLDGKLIAVGVVDILPNCFSSVYMIYDPDYKFLSVGKLSALKEIEYIQKVLYKQAPQLHYYYMGYYIHDCQKMKYKGNYKPSELLCSQSYQWVDLDKAVARLKDKRYSAFIDDAPTTSFSERYPEALETIKMLDAKNQQYTLNSFSQSFRQKLKLILVEYLDNVGPGLASNLYLVFK